MTASFGLSSSSHRSTICAWITLVQSHRAMPLPRSAPLRSLSRTRPTRAIPRSQQWQRTSQRGYADAKESAKEKAQGAADQMKGLRGDATW